MVGCESKPGHGQWNLKVGGEARLVSADGSDITVETFVSASPAKSSRRSPRTNDVEKVNLAAGTPVVVLAIDTDDARVKLKEGPRAGSIYWVECSRLEAVSP
jgi:hypothetical protein